MIKGLGHIGIFVSDAERSKAFYEKIGFVIEGTYQRPGGTVIAFAEAGSCVLELIQPGDKSRVGRPAGVVDHVCIEVLDIDDKVAELKALGIISEDASVGIIEEVYGGFKNIFFEGPDGERMEYVQML
ncbi:MAG: VOC family protein [Christensenellales bacterium]